MEPDSKPSQGLLSRIVYTVLLSGLIVSVGWFLISLYVKIFYPTSIVNVSLTKASSMTLNKQIDCREDGYWDYPLEIELFSYPPDWTSLQRIRSETPIDFAITFWSDGELKITQYSETSGISTTTSQLQFGEEYKGKASKVGIDAPLQGHYMAQYYCAGEIRFFPKEGLLNFMIEDESETQALHVHHYLDFGDQLTFILWNPTEMNDVGGELQQVELTFTVTKPLGGSVEMEFFSEGLDPYLAVQGKPDPASPATTTEENRFSASADELNIQSPTGKLKLDNQTPVALGGVTTFNNENLIMGRELSTGYSLSGEFDTGTVEIYGTTHSILLNGEQLVKGFWDKLPGYVQSALFGLLLTALTASWTFRGSILGWLHDIFPVLPFGRRPEPEKGNFVCVTKSGMIVAGTLESFPSGTNPYYLLKNATRKATFAGKWEKEIIPEIKIREDAVEQTYTL